MDSKTEEGDVMITDANGACGKSQFMQSPGVPGFKHQRRSYDRQRSMLPEIQTKPSTHHGQSVLDLTNSKTGKHIELK